MRIDAIFLSKDCFTFDFLIRFFEKVLLKKHQNNLQDRFIPEKKVA